MDRNQRRRAARTNHPRNQPGDPFKTAIPRVAIPSTGNIQELESLSPDFISWYAQRQFGADIEEVLASLAHFFRFYPEFEGTRSITALDPAEVTAKLISLITHTLLEGVKAALSLMRFVNFLHDSGRWSGSQESFQTLHDILEGISNARVRIAISYEHIPEHVTTETADWP
ncbi:hypothetical protein [Pseudarthrobacter equi]|uniref:hypothetical protein n=1 Tax=Pseudarthrobacter equi TaxID=728066 RepID=UPI0028D2A262|nr:hypothetical protein [Pseudarthrobacter equi]